ncbi:MAG: hypothetical protein E7395_00955, partial [Ruminococcaceae bacterium]|nr:hypothetical protein [Oscillospiraceae bacterium]
MIKAGGEQEFISDVVVVDNKVPVITVSGSYQIQGASVNVSQASEGVEFVLSDVLNQPEVSKVDAVINFLKQTGFSMTDWKSLVMIIISCVLFYLAIVKKFEPLLLLPIAFGMLLTNLMGSEVFHE